MNAAFIGNFEKDGIIKISSRDVYRTAIPKDVRGKHYEISELQANQKKVYEEITKEFAGDRPRPVLLRGITGSGKTLVYMHLIKDVLEKGQQAILLIPEISLTWQTVSRF